MNTKQLKVLAIAGLIVRDNRGAIAVTFALTASVLLGMTALAIDVGRAYSARRHAQNALDAATLAAVVSQTDKEFRGLLAAKGLEPSRGTVELNTTKGAVTANGSYRGAVETTFAAVIGFNRMDFSVSASARAPLKASELTLNLKDAFGWSNKVVTFHAKRPDGQVEAVATITYTMTDHTGAGWRGTGTTTVSPSNTVSLGDYTEIWADMTATSTSSGAVKTFSTNNPQTAHHLFIDGQQMTQGQVVPINLLLPCGTRVEYGWEDDGGPGSWLTQDIFFDVSVECESTDSSSVRLTR